MLHSVCECKEIEERNEEEVDLFPMRCISTTASWLQNLVLPR